MKSLFVFLALSTTQLSQANLANTVDFAVFTRNSNSTAEEFRAASVVDPKYYNDFWQMSIRVNIKASLRLIGCVVIEQPVILERQHEQQIYAKAEVANCKNVRLVSDSRWKQGRCESGYRPRRIPTLEHHILITNRVASGVSLPYVCVRSN